VRLLSTCFLNIHASGQACLLRLGQILLIYPLPIFTKYILSKMLTRLRCSEFRDPLLNILAI
jgi:hypothetical protein